MDLAKVGVAAGALAVGVLVWMLGATTAPTPGAAPVAAAATSSSFVVRGVRVFDGERFVDGRDVRVADGLIAEVGEGLVVPEGVDVVEGRGRTLLPGFIDAHVHTWGGARGDALRFGVTTQIDLFSDVRQLADFRRGREDTTQATQADVWSAGTLATAAGGHGTQFGLTVPTLASPADADAWVRARRDEGSDFIKLVREDLHVYGAPALPSLDDATAAAVIAAAHAHALRALVHASAQEDARASLRDGADGLVHVFQDTPADAAFVALAKSRDAFVVPTLAVVAGFSGETSPLADDPRARAFLSADQRQSLAQRMHAGAPTPALLANALESVRRLHAGGVRLLAGTDAPNPNTAHGVSMHEEIRWLAKAGLSPAEALAAATSVPADAFGLADRGRIAPGLRADLVLVEGDPSADLADTLAIARIWKNGRAVERRLDAVQSPVLAAGPVSHFDGGQADSRLGSGWTATTDRMAGGASDAAIAVVDGGADGSRGALDVRGTVRANPAGPVWAGAFLNPGDTMMQANDGRALRELVFSVRGDGPLAVLLFSGRQGGAPAVQIIEATPEWTRVVVPLSGFAGADLAQLRAFAVTTDVPGEFAFQLDAVEIR